MAGLRKTRPRGRNWARLRKRGACYQIRSYRNGQRIEESTGFTKYDEARDMGRAARTGGARGG